MDLTLKKIRTMSSEQILESLLFIIDAIYNKFSFANLSKLLMTTQSYFPS